jgi:hypothetical protein
VVRSPIGRVNAPSRCANGASELNETPAIRPPPRSSVVSDCRTSFNCAVLKSMLTAWLPRTRPTCSKYPTPFLYSTTRRTGSFAAAAAGAAVLGAGAGL